MKMEWHETPKGNLIFSGKVDLNEVKKIMLDEDEHKAFSKPVYSAADMLLKLQLLFSAYEKQRVERK